MQIESHNRKKNDTIIGKIAYGGKDRQHGSQGML